MTITDIVIILFLLITLANGYCSGFLRSLIGPVSLGLAMVWGWVYYGSTHDIRISLAITLLGPFILSWLMKAGLERLFSPADLVNMSALSRWSGMVVSLCWGGAMLLMTIVMLCFFPFERFELENVGKDVHQSRVMAMVRPVLIEHGVLPKPVSASAKECTGDACQMNTAAVEALANDKEVQELMADPRMKKLLEDQEINQAVANKNMTAMLTNPSILELTQDPAFVAKVIKLYPRIRQITDKQQ